MVMELEKLEGKRVLFGKNRTLLPEEVKLLTRRRGVGKVIHHDAPKLPLPLEVDGVDERLLAREVAVDRSGADVRLFGDERDRGPVKATLGKELESGFEDGVALVVRSLAHDGMNVHSLRRTRAFVKRGFGKKSSAC